MPVNVGNGASFGNNFGGGGIIYVDNIVPAPNTLVLPSVTLNFTIAVNGGMVDLASIQITTMGEPAFDGSIPAFDALYSSSTYTYNPSANGYDFAITRTGGFIGNGIPVTIVASTIDGAVTNQIYSVQTNITPAYPPTPFGVALIAIPMDRFSGEITSGLIGEDEGQVFLSPGLVDANPLVQLDVDDVRLSTDNAEHCFVKQTNNLRPFVWGPPFSSPPVGAPVFPPLISTQYMPTLNNPEYSFVKNEDYSVVGVLHDTILDTDTIILY